MNLVNKIEFAIRELRPLIEEDGGTIEWETKRPSENDGWIKVKATTVYSNATRDGNTLKVTNDGTVETYGEEGAGGFADAFGMESGIHTFSCTEEKLEEAMLTFRRIWLNAIEDDADDPDPEPTEIQKLLERKEPFSKEEIKQGLVDLKTWIQSLQELGILDDDDTLEIRGNPEIEFLDRVARQMEENSEGGN